MPIERMTIPKAVQQKLTSQSNKPHNVALLTAMRNSKNTVGPGGSTVMWEPSNEFLLSAAPVLIREETFTRNRNIGNAMHKEMLAFIELLKTKIKDRGLTLPVIVVKKET